MTLQDVQVGALVSVDFLIGEVVRLDRKGMVPSALISWKTDSKNGCLYLKCRILSWFQRTHTRTRRKSRAFGLRLVVR